MRPLAPLLLASAVLAVGALTPAANPTVAAPGSVPVTSFPGLVRPVLATDDRGGQLLLARRYTGSVAASGPVVATSLRTGATRWSRPVTLSSQRRTVGLAADIAGTGRGLIAWTAGGNVFVRDRFADGRWGKQTLLSRRTGTRWVSVDVNRAGDQLVAWRQEGRVYLAWRPAGGAWHRWLGPGTPLRPTAALGERRDGTATARVVWLTGTGTGTEIHGRRVPITASTPDAERVLATRPEIRDFAWDAGATRETLLITHVRQPTDPYGDGADTLVTAYDGSLDAVPLGERWHMTNGDEPTVRSVGGRTRALSNGYINHGADGISTHLASWFADEGTWDKGHVADYAGDFDDSARGSLLDMDAGGRGIWCWSHQRGGTWYLTFRRVGSATGFYLTIPAWAGLDDGAIGVGLKGRMAVAWTTGPPTRPVVGVRVIPTHL